MRGVCFVNNGHTSRSPAFETILRHRFTYCGRSRGRQKSYLDLPPPLERSATELVPCMTLDAQRYTNATRVVSIEAEMPSMEVARSKPSLQYQERLSRS